MSSGELLSPAVLSTFQDVYIEKLVHALNGISGYSLSLFYVIAGIEIAVFGLVWAIRQEELFGEFFFKVLKLGILFFLISEYPALLQSIINGFTQVAFQISPEGTHSFIFHPALIWKYGFDHGIEMLMVAVQDGNTNMALSNLFLWLGFGNLLMFALIGIQIILAVVGFYVVSLVALLLIPLGGFVGTHSFLSRALEGVLRSGVRVFVVILIVGIAVSVWSSFPLDPLTITTSFDKPLSLFLSALVVLVLLWKLPEVAVQLVGEIKGDIWGRPATSVSVSPMGSGSGGSTTSLHAVASGAYVAPYGGIHGDRSTGGSFSGGSMGGMGVSQVAAATSVQVMNASTAGGLLSSGNTQEMKSSSEIRGKNHRNS